MKQEQLQDALSELPEELIASTAQARAKKKVIWGPWVALAACACLAVLLSTQVMPMFSAKNAAAENAEAALKSPAMNGTHAYRDEQSVVQDSSANVSVLLAEVVEIRGDTILVAPLEGQTLNTDSRISVRVGDGTGYAVGDRLRIRYDGTVMETWPLQLGRVFGIERISGE